jgi:hypothetical protein
LASTTSAYSRTPAASIGDIQASMQLVQLQLATLLACAT